MLKEFKEFIMRGNVVDMAVGVVIGAAFKAIVDSLVGNIIMPLVGLMTAGVDLNNLKFVLKAAVLEAGTEVAPEVAIAYGSFIQAILNFLLIALCLFLLVKGMNKLRRPKVEEVAEAAPVEKSAEVLLLEEIRDSLKKP